MTKDDEDPYLVVAADKGTASFSDIANAIAPEYHFWLGDAFASGGSAGYDHKKMGITARGAWVSVQRHFREMDIDIQSTDFTVVGIGDMAGDVFGNGMLLSGMSAWWRRSTTSIFSSTPIRIRAAVLPSAPDCSRCRAPVGRTTITELISDGGGVFERAAKSIVFHPR